MLKEQGHRTTGDKEYLSPVGSPIMGWITALPIFVSVLGCLVFYCKWQLSSPPAPEPMPEEDRQRQLAEHPGRALETVGKITARPLPEAIVERIMEDNLRNRH